MCFVLSRNSGGDLRHHGGMWTVSGTSCCLCHLYETYLLPLLDPMTSDRTVHPDKENPDEEYPSLTVYDWPTAVTPEPSHAKRSTFIRRNNNSYLALVITETVCLHYFTLFFMSQTNQVQWFWLLYLIPSNNNHFVCIPFVMVNFLLCDTCLSLLLI